MAHRRIEVDSSLKSILHDTMPVTMMHNSKKINQVVRDLWDTASAIGPECIGLAAPQINERERICVIKQGSRVLINPTIVSKFGKIPSIESCFSLPGYQAIIPRFKHITISYYDQSGKNKALSVVHRQLSIVIQHEIDHLNGVLISDYVDEKHGKTGGIISNQYDINSFTTKTFAMQMRAFGPVEQSVIEKS